MYIYIYVERPVMNDQNWVAIVPWVEIATATSTGVYWETSISCWCDGTAAGGACTTVRTRYVCETITGV